MLVRAGRCSSVEAGAVEFNFRTPEEASVSEPRVAGTRPAVVRLEAGKTVYWCSCGRSRTQPFCDGSHEGTGFEPLKFTAPREEDYWFCTCKYTAKPPFCDGAHKRFER